jgi:hypothetical protein
MMPQCSTTSISHSPGHTLIIRTFYRRGLAQLDAYCRNTYGQLFVRLNTAQQDHVIITAAGALY